MWRVHAILPLRSHSSSSVSADSRTYDVWGLELPSGSETKPFASSVCGLKPLVYEALSY
jgi:hypothetical protein